MSHKAWQNAHAMYENDACAKALGIDIISMDEGFAVSRVQKARRVGCLICAILLVPDVSSGPGEVKRQGQKSIRPVL